MSIAHICLVISAGLLIGASKAGLKGLGIIVVALLVIVYGSRASTGILVPMLIVGDILAVVYYQRHVRWHYLMTFLPAMILGILLAVWFGHGLSEEAFKYSMGTVIILSVVIMFWWDLRGSGIALADNKWIAGSSGVAAGFATMIGNLAGPFANMFFLATKLPKNEIIGTAAWLFLIVNVIKLPMHIWIWETITTETLRINILFAPTIFIGFWIGHKLVAMINEQFYRYFLLVASAIGAIAVIL
jgi:uncharacterized protein